jgi:hypothetical protein
MTEKTIIEEIEKMIADAWGEFKTYYDNKAPEYSKKWSGPRGEPQKDHWICWNEHDLCFQVGRFFYDKLNKKKEENEDFSDIEIHFEKKLDTINFGDHTFAKEGKLEKLKLILQQDCGMKEGPKIDIIIAHESSNGPFLLCAEVKCFRTAVSGSEIDKDIKKLSIIEKEGIAPKVVFMVFDDYYKKPEHKIESIRSKAKASNKNLNVLSHNSKKKLPDAE